MGGKNVLLAVPGGIAAYKSCDVLRRLQDAWCDVRVVMTKDAERLVGPVTFEALSKHPVADDLYSYPDSAIPHIFLADWADLVLVCPATANVMAKMAAGIADDCLTTTLLACHTPVLIAPAMNVNMWQNPATQDNLSTLRSRGVQVVMPVTGLLACGDVGTGKLASVDEIVSSTLAVLESSEERKDLAGLTIVVNAGPTHEAIDPVRFISNASSGKMGFAIARRAAERGARVKLIAGPVSLPTPHGVERTDVVSARDMLDSTCAAFDDADVAICTAAVADYTPAAPADHKLKKSVEHIETIRLVETRDILAELCSVKGDRVVVGFAAETNDLIAYATAKLERKGADMIVANDVSRSESTFGSDTNRVSLVTRAGVEELPLMTKDEVADAILSRVSALVAERA